MNDNTQMTSAPGASLLPSGTSVLTTMHLAIMAIFAILVIAGIVWGIRKKARRRAAERRVVADTEHLAPHEDKSEEEPAAKKAPNAPPTPTPAPVSPAPPPLSDAPVLGTPPTEHAIADEPIAAAAPFEASPAAEATPTPTDASATIPLTTLKGLGPKVAARLDELGIADAADLAALDDDAAARVDAELGSFSGRMARDRWIEQARLLTAGDRAGYEATFGKL